MNQPKKYPWLPWAAAGLGAAAGLLRWLLYTFTADYWGLVAADTLLEKLLWLCVLISLCLTAWGVFHLDGDGAYDKNFAASYPAFAGHILAAAGIFLTVSARMTQVEGALGMLWRVLGFLSVPLLAWAGWARFQGKKPGFALHLIPCLFFILQIVSRYRDWSGTPQVQDYVFALLGILALMLYAFQMACFDVELGKRRQLLFYGLAAVCLCLAEAFHSEAPWLYLGGAAWAGTNLCTFAPSPKPPKPAEPEEAEKSEQSGKPQKPENTGEGKA